MGFSRERYERVLERIAQAARRTGRSPDEIRLVSVTKTQPAEIVAEAIEGGVRVLGENRVQEARQKRNELEPELAARARWHLIGSLQRNKARQVPGLFDVVESVDSLPLARELARRAKAAGVAPLEVLVQVNTGKEPQKGGILPEDVLGLLREIGKLEALHPSGLMCIPPLGRSAEESRPHFRILRELRDQAQEKGLALVQTLSMGMSEDFEVAIEEGSTCVRIGTAIFGPRAAP
ncbi:YggS family pyridoxal phosphate-dependent enzyme [Nitrospinota bacterium]